MNHLQVMHFLELRRDNLMKCKSFEELRDCNTAYFSAMIDIEKFRYENRSRRNVSESQHATQVIAQYQACLSGGDFATELEKLVELMTDDVVRRTKTVESIKTILSQHSSPTVGRGDIHGGDRGYIIYSGELEIIAKRILDL